MNACSPWEEKPLRLEVEDNRYSKWELIHDPDESMPIGGTFSLEDIARGDKLVWDCWVKGTKFRNKINGKIMTVYVYKLIYIGRNKTDPVRAVMKYRISKPSNQLEMEM